MTALKAQEFGQFEFIGVLRNKLYLLSHPQSFLVVLFNINAERSASAMDDGKEGRTVKAHLYTLRFVGPISWHILQQIFINRARFADPI